MLSKKESTQKVDLADFDLLQMLGQGGWSKVMLAQKKDTKEVLAMKVLKKQFLRRKDEVGHIQAERRIMASLNHPNIVKLRYAFQSCEKLFFLLEFCPGGELFTHLASLGSFKEETAKFYAAQIVDAVGYLHSKDILYRDLKPENLLIDVDGYLKVADFGLAKENVNEDNKTRTFCGTPCYLAPEMVYQKKYGKAVDWWALGCVIYELLTGVPPFHDRSPMKTYELIVDEEYEIPFPEHISQECRDLILALLSKDPESRLGAGATDVEEIKAHPWFADMDWDALLARRLTAPLVPVLTSPTDTKYFDEEWTRLKAYDSFEYDRTEEEWDNFSFVGEDLDEFAFSDSDSHSNSDEYEFSADDGKKKNSD